MATSDLGVEEIGPDFVTSLVSGALAGLSVDLMFYPIDTVKTRLQSAQGFWKSGGFHGVYRGMGSVAVGSAPGGAYLQGHSYDANQVFSLRVFRHV